MSFEGVFRDVFKNSVHLGHDAASVDNQIPTFRGKLLPSSSNVYSSKKTSTY
jgi:hypothetical protein